MKKIQTFSRKRFFGDNGLGIQVTGPQHRPQPPLHRHDFHELVLVVEGQGRHVTELNKYPIAAGSVFLIAEAEVHAYEDVEGLAICNILFDKAELGPFQDELGHQSAFRALFSLEPALRRRQLSQNRFRIPLHGVVELRKHLQWMRTTIREEGQAYQTMVRGLFAVLIAALIRYCDQDPQPSSRALLRMGQTITYLELNHARDIAVDELAEVARMSRSSFLRAFRAATQTSPIQFLLRFRIERAAELLRSSHANVTDVALSVGFSDSNYFSRQFKRLMGMNPKAYAMSARG